MRRLLQNILAERKTPKYDHEIDFTAYTDNHLIELIKTTNGLEKNANALYEIMKRNTSNVCIIKLKEKIAICLEEI